MRDDDEIGTLWAAASATLRHVPHAEVDAASLLEQVESLRDDVSRGMAGLLAGWAPRLRRAAYRESAENLAAYLALRRHDLRALQIDLMPLGLSSLGRCESRVLPSLDAVSAALLRIALGKTEAAFPSREAFFRGTALLERETRAVFGPAAGARTVRIMVTLGDRAAEDAELVHDLIARGTDVVRINAAHDDETAWRSIAALVQRANERLGRRCRVCLDLVGPRARTGATVGSAADARVHVGDTLWLVGQREMRPDGDEPAVICTLPEALAQVRPGEVVTIDEGSLETVVRAVEDRAVRLEVVRAPAKGVALKPSKGLNFPATELRISPLTRRDLAALDVAAEIADIVGYSFVQRPDDIVRLDEELSARTTRAIALVLKVETATAVRNLPELIVEAAGRRPGAVMIARGDLAVEIGYSRLAEIQEEVLWLCEAAHVPVIWATHVLDTFVKKGVHSRGEMTDAAMAERAECVMLNRGDFVAEAVSLLDDVLSRMESHQAKKTSRLRALRAW
jgi:pyruvate kinase